MFLVVYIHTKSDYIIVLWADDSTIFDIACITRKKININERFPLFSSEFQLKVYLPDSARVLTNTPRNLSIIGWISSSNSCLFIFLCKSSSSIKLSMWIVASKLALKIFLYFSIASKSLSLFLVLFLGSQPYFYKNSSPIFMRSS